MTSNVKDLSTAAPPHWINRMLAGALRTPGLQRILGRSLALLTVTGAKTDTRYTIPVSYQRSGDTVTVITKRPRTWWRNLRSRPEVEIRLAGERRTGTAELSIDDEAIVPLMVDLMSQSAVDARAYGLRLQSDGRVSEDEVRALLPQLVVITVRLA